MSRPKPDYTACHQIILSLWNEFAEENGYPTEEKLNSLTRRKLNARLRIDDSFLKNFPDTLQLIHTTCKTNEYGQPLDLYQFVRSTVYLKATVIREALAQEAAPCTRAL